LFGKTITHITLLAVNSTKNILRISYPIILTLVAQNIINVTDTAFLGRVSEVALGASAVAGVFYFAIYMVGFGFSQGVQILIGRRNGETNYLEIGTIFNNGLIFNAILASILFVSTLFSVDYVMKFLVSSPHIYQASIEYLDWRIYGYFFVFLNVIFRSFYVGITQTRVLTISAFITAITNIILDYVLIFGKFGFPELGIAGAAIASVIAEAASTVYLVYHTYTRMDVKKYGLVARLKTDFKTIGQILNLSIFVMFQFFISISTWFLFFIFIERMGERPLAVTNIGRSMYILMMIPASALSTTASTLISNMIGAGLKEEVIKTTNKIIGIALILVSPVIVIALIFPELFAHIYTDDPSLIMASVPVIRVVCFAIIFFAAGNVVVNSVSGTGSTQVAFYLELVTLIFYVSYIYYTAIYNTQPVEIVWMSEFVYWSLIGGLGYLFLKKGKWRENKI
jgi:putative MATE family efflux protein